MTLKDPGVDVLNVSLEEFYGVEKLTQKAVRIACGARRSLTSTVGPCSRDLGHPDPTHWGMAPSGRLISWKDKKQT